MKKSSVGDLNKRAAEGSWQYFLKSLNFPGGRRGKGKTSRLADPKWMYHYHPWPI